jgi:hypothetical protein
VGYYEIFHTNLFVILINSLGREAEEFGSRLLLRLVTISLETHSYLDIILPFEVTKRVIHNETNRKLYSVKIL